MNNLPKVESWRHLNVFETYLLMGPARTIPALSQATGISRVVLNSWRRGFKWNDRLDVRDKKAMSVIETENNKIYINTVKRRHQEAYQKVTEKALDYINARGSSFALSKTAMRDAAMSLDIGVKGERQVLGLSDAKLKGALVKEGFAALLEVVMPQG